MSECQEENLCSLSEMVGLDPIFENWSFWQFK